MEPSKEAISVKNMHTLQQEKARLRRLCRAMENEAEGRLSHVKKNYGAMAFNSVFPHVDSQMGVAKLLGYAAKGAVKSSRFKSGLLTAVITVVEIVGAKKIVGLFEKLFRKKNKDEDQKEEKREKEKSNNE